MPMLQKPDIGVSKGRNYSLQSIQPPSQMQMQYEQEMSKKNEYIDDDQIKELYEMHKNKNRKNEIPNPCKSKKILNWRVDNVWYS